MQANVNQQAWGSTLTLNQPDPEDDPLSGDAERLNRHLELAKLCVSAQVGCLKV